MTAPQWPPHSLLAILPDEARERLLSRGVLRRHQGPSRILIREHDESRSVIVILSGVVKVTGSVPNGPDAFLAIRMGGDAVGEFAAVDQLPRSATVTTCGTVVARVINADDFIDCLRGDPDIAHAISKTIVAKTRVSNQHQIDFSSALLHLVTSYGKPTPVEDHGKAVIDVPLTQSELASLAVASPPAAERALRWLRECGIVATGYRSITILDIERLHQVAYTG
jgi:CRP/FNR family transcriptional regulator, cyclic AMP receptor protein